MRHENRLIIILICAVLVISASGCSISKSQESRVRKTKNTTAVQNTETKETATEKTTEMTFSETRYTGYEEIETDPPSIDDETPLEESSAINETSEEETHEFYIESSADSTSNHTLRICEEITKVSTMEECLQLCDSCLGMDIEAAIEILNGLFYLTDTYDVQNNDGLVCLNLDVAHQSNPYAEDVALVVNGENVVIQEVRLYFESKKVTAVVFSTAPNSVYVYDDNESAHQKYDLFYKSLVELFNSPPDYLFEQTLDVTWTGESYWIYNNDRKVRLEWGEDPRCRNYYGAYSCRIYVSNSDYVFLAE